jgi:hypothetical protein
MFLLNEFIQSKGFEKKFINKTIDITVVTFPADGIQTIFSVGESIGFLFNVSINGLIQERDVDYFHVATTSKITFTSPPYEGSQVAITYYKGRNNVWIDNYGKAVQLTHESFVYDGTTLVFRLTNSIDSVVTLDINGLIQEEGVGFDISSRDTITLNGEPLIGDSINVTYIY